MASRAKIVLVIGKAKAPMTMDRITPSRATEKPPANTPTIDMATPNAFLASAISVFENPRSR